MSWIRSTNSTQKSTLPPGQVEIEFFPRFGLPQYAKRCRRVFDSLELSISGDVNNSLKINAQMLQVLPRIQQKSDFHCVTTWTKRNLNWGGYHFTDFYQQIILPRVKPSAKTKWVTFRCQDGFRAILLLEDLLSTDVLLADSLNNKPLTSEHGAPMRLIAPAHYGFKNTKHLKVIEFWEDNSHFKPTALHFMDHPRARVKYEERGRWIPVKLLRYLYRALIKPTLYLYRNQKP